MSDGMAAEKIIQFEAIQGRRSISVQNLDTVQHKRVVVDLRQVRIARALDAVSAGMYHEHKAPPVAVGADVAEYRRRIRAGNYAVDAEELAASILDSLLPHK